MLCIAIGAACYCVGLALRYALHKQPESAGEFLKKKQCVFVVLIRIR